MTLVTRVTARAASADQLTEADYRDIYDEVRGRAPDTGDYRVSLRAFVGLIAARLPGQETLSIGYWSKYHNGDIQLTRRARQELRAVVGLASLPPTVAEATSTVSPDAAVYQVGSDSATRVVMVGADVDEPITLHLNGHVEIIAAPTHEARVTAVTTPRARRTPSRAIRVSPSAFERLSAARQQSGLTWDAFLSHLLGEEAR